MDHKLYHFVLFINVFKIDTVFYNRNNITVLCNSALSFVPGKINSECKNKKYLYKDRLCLTDVLSLYLLCLIIKLSNYKTRNDKICTMISTQKDKKQQKENCIPFFPLL